MSNVNVTEEINIHAQQFSGLNRTIGIKLDYSESSLKTDIDLLMPSFRDSGDGVRPPKDIRHNSARFLAYIASTLCKIYDARCMGKFDLDAGLAPHYYLLSIQFPAFSCNITDGVGRAIDGQWTFGEYYLRLAKAIKNGKS